MSEEKKATPSEELRRQFMDHSTPLNEAGHWARRHLLLRKGIKMGSYLLGLNIFQSGKHHTKIYLRADFSNGIHHQVEISKSESAKGVERALT